MLRWIALLLLLASPALAQNSNIYCPSGTPAAGAPQQWVPCTFAAPRTLVPLDVSTVTTGGTAVTALAAGHRSAGGWLYNPSTATINLCIDESGAVASGTSSQGNLSCIPPNTTYNLTPSPNSVSVITSDSSHPFSGFGFQ